MKTKALIFVLAGIIGAFGISGCSADDPIILPTEKAEICTDASSGPLSELEVRLVHEMSMGYKEHQGLAIDSEFNFPDAKSIWFDLETLKAFLFHLENEATKGGAMSDKLGIRIYYSRYPEEGTEWNSYPDLQGNVTEDYASHHTLVAIPTINREGVDFDFNPTDLRTYTVPLYDVNELGGDYLSASAKKIMGFWAASKSGGSGNSTGAQNHGSLIPPGNPQGQGF